MPVQRWRLTFERGAAAAAVPQQEIDEAWENGLARFRPVSSALVERPRLMIGAPLPAGMTAGLELADLFLPERYRVADVRSALTAALPADHRLVDLYDVWLGEPALPGLVVAGDYRVTIAGTDEAEDCAGLPLSGMDGAVQTLLDATELARTRTKGGRTTTGNLRPLVLDVVAVDSPDRTPCRLDLWMRLRFHPSQGTGRPEEVVAALSSILGHPLRVIRTHRERLWLQGESPS